MHTNSVYKHVKIEVNTDCPTFLARGISSIMNSELSSVILFFRHLQFIITLITFDAGSVLEIFLWTLVIIVAVDDELRGNQIFR